MRLVQVDAFTDVPFRGNPAAVCIGEDAFDDDWMQRLAAEINLSETAFLRPRRDGYDLRWFTPTIEVDLCGHATLASAHVLWEEGIAPVPDPVHFHTRSGELVATGSAGWIELDFPSLPAQPIAAPSVLGSALRLRDAQMLEVGRSKFDLLVRVRTEQEVKALRPNFAELMAIEARGVIVTAPGDHSEHDFVSRFFGPRSGVDEDPVTGSAHCVLAPYWASRLGSEELVGYQASERGGIVRVRVEGPRVQLGGGAITIFRTDLDLARLMGCESVGDK